jgi:hypothetical protein
MRWTFLVPSKVRVAEPDAEQHLLVLGYIPQSGAP